MTIGKSSPQKETVHLKEVRNARVVEQLGTVFSLHPPGVADAFDYVDAEIELRCLAFDT